MSIFYKKTMLIMLLITMKTFASSDIRVVPSTISLLAGGRSENRVIVSQHDPSSEVSLNIKELPKGVTAIFRQHPFHQSGECLH